MKLSSLSGAFTLALSACTEATPDAQTANDAAPALAACGEQFIAAETNLPDAGRITVCQPLSADGITVDVSNCIPIYATATGNSGFSLSAAGNGTPFSALGPTMLGVGLIGRGSPCASADGYCSYRTGPMVCRAVVTRAGRVGDSVEAEIREPCRLFGTDGVETLIVDRLRVRGVLRLRFEINQQTHSDGGVQRAVECGVP